VWQKYSGEVIPHARPPMGSPVGVRHRQVNQKLLLQNEYVAAENRILRALDPERSILAWYRRLIARKLDGSKFRISRRRPRIEPELEALIVRFVRENSGWGYDRSPEHWPISATLFRIRLSETSFADMGCNWHPSAASTPRGRISSLPTWPSWQAPLLHRGSAHLARSRHLLPPVLHSSGIAPRHSRRFDQTSRLRMDASDGSQRHRREFRFSSWTTMPSSDRDTKFCVAFLDVLRSSAIHRERNHQGKDNLLLFPYPDVSTKCRTARCRDQLGGLFKCYSRVA
jgi:hypothetical protein